MDTIQKMETELLLDRNMDRKFYQSNNKTAFTTAASGVEKTHINENMKGKATPTNEIQRTNSQQNRNVQKLKPNTLITNSKNTTPTKM